MNFDAKYWTIVIVSIVLVASCLWVINKETGEKMKEMEEIAAGPRGDVLFKSRCGSCHKFDTFTEGVMNLGSISDKLDADKLRSFIEQPPAPMVAWDGTPGELDKLVEYLQAGSGMESSAEEMGGTAEEKTAEPVPGTDTGAVTSADALFTNKCGACHKFDTTTAGPMNLAKIAEKMDQAKLKSFIQSPPAPVTAWGGPAEDLDKLVQYLISGPGGSPAPAPVKEEAPAATGAAGGAVFKSKCGACHQFDATSAGPMNLGKIAGKMDQGKLKSFIQSPPAPMTAWSGSPTNLDNLVKYLLAGPGGG